MSIKRFHISPWIQVIILSKEWNISWTLKIFRLKISKIISTTRSTIIITIISLYWPLLLVSPLDRIQCPHKPDECKFLLVGQHWCGHVYESTGERSLWVCSYFTSCTWHVLLILLEWFVRWEVSSYTAPVLSGAVSRIFSKQHKASLYHSHIDFFPGVSLKSK